MQTKSILAGILLLTSLCAQLRADGLIVIHGAPPRPGHFSFAPLEVSYHHVDVRIDDRIAVTSVDQEFYNPNNQRLEGTYLFPLPEGATIDKFSMDIDGKMMDAELLDARKARETYEEIVRKYRDPALLEYVGRGAMKVRIFPIEPHSKKRIKLSYTQVVNADSSMIQYSYPLNTEKFSAKPLNSVSIKVNLTSRTPIKSIYSPSHDIEIRRSGDRQAAVGFEAKNVRPDIDFKLIVSHERDPVGVSLLTYAADSDSGYFMLMASPGEDVAENLVQAKDICFVVDTSGSMAGAKLEQAKKALNFCLANLNSGDRFEIVRFATEAESLFGSLQPATRENRDKALEFVEKLKATGGTAIDDALKNTLAIEHDTNRPYQIIFLTDGQPTVGETREDQIVSRVGRPEQKVRIFPFGIGTDVNTTLLDRIANDTRAFSQYVLPQEDIEVKVSSFYTKVQSPVLTNVKLDYTGFRASEVYPSGLPDLFKGETVTVFGRYELNRGGGAPSVRLSGTLNGRNVSFTSRVEIQTERQSQNAFIPRLWATRRVGWLLDEIRLRGESRELRDEVTQLAREHGIVTPYTAYLILEDEQRRNVPVSSRNMRELETDRRAQEQAERFYSSAGGRRGRGGAGPSGLERAGSQAVANATNLNELKLGTNVQQGQQAAGLDKDLPASAPAAEGYRVAQNYSQQVRLVNGRAFYQNGNTWTDNTAQSKQNLRRQEIKFNSEEYFVLLARYPSAIPWFSLGEEVDVVIEDTLYVVR